MARKKKNVVVVDYGAQQLKANEGEFRKPGLVRQADGAFIQLEERGEGAGKAKRARVVAGNVIDRYYFAQPAQLTWRQWESARMVQAIWNRARVDGIRVTNFQGLSGGRPQITNSQCEARSEYNKMKHALGSLETVIYWVVIGNSSARDFGTYQGMGRTDGMGVLRFALSALADYYNLPHRQG